VREENVPAMYEDTERNLNTDPSDEKEETTTKGGDAPESPSPSPAEGSATAERAEPSPVEDRSATEATEAVSVDLTELRPTVKEAGREG
jgi:hypothetical protein